MIKALRIVRRALGGLVTILLVLILLANGYTLVAKTLLGQQAPTVFSFSSAVVLTGSMSGTIEANDLILTHSQSNYQVGDIIMYQGETSTVTHRIIEIQPEGYLTKGDANNTHDQIPIPPSRVIGKVVWIIPQAGNVILFFKTPLGMLILVLTLLLSIELPALLSRKELRKGETADAQSNQIPPR